MTKNYTAVLSIHGIGRHQRYANAGALLSAVEAVVGNNNTDKLDTIIEVKPAIEPARDNELEADVPMLQLNRARRFRGRLSVGAAFRVYEVNWSPDTRTRVPLSSMLAWTVSLIRSSFRRDPTSWLKWPRLRLARLRLTAERAASPVERHAFAVLASAYRKYRGSLGANYRRARGTTPDFSDFVNFGAEAAKGSATEKNLSDAARAWRHTRLPCEARLRSSGLIALGGLTILILIGAAVVAPFVGNAHLGSFGSIVIPILLLTAPTLSLIFGNRFLTTVFSDVRYWSALNENDAFHETRNAILSRTRAMLRHLVRDPACVRVILVSHSLGTAIAYDALRSIGLYNRARAQSPAEQIPMRKVETLITMGSPIDKLALLFETSGGRSFREELLREELRGDLTTAPFWVDGKQRIKWLNFWDRIDPVSDPLFAPLGTKPFGDHFDPTAIENIEVSNTARYDPAMSHRGYLTNPTVAARVFNEIFRPEEPLIATEVSSSLSRRWFGGAAALSIWGFGISLFAFTMLHFIAGAWFFDAILRVALGTLIAGLVGCLLLLTAGRR